MSNAPIHAPDAKNFCTALASIDDVVDDINKDGPVEIEVPADMGVVLDRLGRKLSEVAKSAPTPELRDAVTTVADTFNTSARTLLADPPMVGLARAQEIFAETMEGIEDGGVAVRAFRAEYCEADASLADAA